MQANQQFESNNTYIKKIIDDNAISSLNLNSDRYESFNLNNGDSVKILLIPSVESTMDVFGK